ncbi:Stp1/IreP family PP2C-type Ser/Thr phosphatase [Enterococcus dongliensis]|uniref:Stp1/IreP family PP2C-type Ser/Thr phosphatase n=1 Tax=Enterococcus dongliensis TaxID=2559925 RepID=UPI00288DCB33|nr:Stp1/IreP family PP2C-type Ser/Thr phosphatase [Enterococcus dongliensis]MDT2642133.1 Stp1/IreP family PP2C-type Ser/Thr phosphatase [Enterococcus dongliensis]
MEIQFQSDIGKRRNMNQDYANVFINQAGMDLAILADGMGGHLAGDVASKMAVDGLGAAWSTSTIAQPEEATQWFLQEIQKINESIYQEGIAHPEMQGMGTTIVSTALLDETFVLAHVGDSRAYLVQKGQLQQLTDDHSLVNELLKSGEITEEMAAIHPQKNVLTRSVGFAGEVKTDVSQHQCQPNDYLLLCSDGLTNMVSEADILAIVESDQSLETKTKQLIDAANEAGGADNITVLLIHFEGEARP